MILDNHGAWAGRARKKPAPATLAMPRCCKQAEGTRLVCPRHRKISDIERPEPCRFSFRTLGNTPPPGSPDSPASPAYRRRGRSLSEGSSSMRRGSSHRGQSTSTRMCPLHSSIASIALACCMPDGPTGSPPMKKPAARKCYPPDRRHGLSAWPVTFSTPSPTELPSGSLHSHMG